VTEKKDVIVPFSYVTDDFIKGGSYSDGLKKLYPKIDY